jgi:hypothetical protein
MFRQFPQMSETAGCRRLIACSRKRFSLRYQTSAALTALLGGCDQVSKAPMWSLRDFGLRDRGLPNSRCQSCARPERNADHPDEGQTDCDAPDSYDPTC